MDTFKVVQIAEEEFNVGESYINYLIKDSANKTVDGTRLVNMPILNQVFNIMKSSIPDLTITEQTQDRFTFQSNTYGLTLFFEANSDELLGAINSTVLDRDKMYKLLGIVDNILADSLSKKRRLSHGDDNYSKRVKIGSRRRRKTNRRRKTHGTRKH